MSDERLRKTSELLMGIKYLKLLGWEFTFADSVKQIRNKELKLLKKDAIYVALNSKRKLLRDLPLLSDLDNCKWSGPDF